MEIMKNKQVEELLNNFQEILDNPTTTDECYDGRIIEIDRSYDLEQDEIKLLLSHIRELEKENKELKDMTEEPIQIPNFLFDMSQELKIDELEKELQTTANKCKQLENNRNEAVREIMYMIENCDISYYQGKKLENILIGDSE